MKIPAVQTPIFQILTTRGKIVLPGGVGFLVLLFSKWRAEFSELGVRWKRNFRSSPPPLFPLSPGHEAPSSLENTGILIFMRLRWGSRLAVCFPSPSLSTPVTTHYPSPVLSAWLRYFFLRTRIQWTFSSLIPLGLEVFFFPPTLKTGWYTAIFFPLCNVLLLLKQH